MKMRESGLRPGHIFLGKNKLKKKGIKYPLLMSSSNNFNVVGYYIKPIFKVNSH
jgi:hypothetical protein